MDCSIKRDQGFLSHVLPQEKVHGGRGLLPPTGGALQNWWGGLESEHGGTEHGGAPKKEFITRLLVTFGLKINKNALINIG